MKFYFQEKLKLVTVLGAGLLCGTALAVIVPEGVHALYEDLLEGKKTTLILVQGILNKTDLDCNIVILVVQSSFLQNLNTFFKIHFPVHIS